MSRSLLLVFLFVCLVYISQVSINIFLRWIRLILVNDFYNLYHIIYAVVLYVIVDVQANPLPQDAQQSVSSNFDDLTNKAKQIFDDAKGALEKSELNDALEKAKSFIGQAGENIRKEIEKIAEKLRD